MQCSRTEYCEKCCSPDHVLVHVTSWAARYYTCQRCRYTWAVSVEDETLSTTSSEQERTNYRDPLVRST